MGGKLPEIALFRKKEGIGGSPGIPISICPQGTSFNERDGALKKGEKEEGSREPTLHETHQEESLQPGFWKKRLPLEEGEESVGVQISCRVSGDFSFRKRIRSTAGQSRRMGEFKSSTLESSIGEWNIKEGSVV